MEYNGRRGRTRENITFDVNDAFSLLSRFRTMHVRVDTDGSDYIAIACLSVSPVTECVVDPNGQWLTAIQQTSKSNPKLMEFALETTILILGGDYGVPAKRKHAFEFRRYGTSAHINASF